MKNKKNQRGFALLLELLFCCLILAVLSVLSLPAVTKTMAVKDASRIAATMKHIQAAETYHTQIYHDGYRSLGVLAIPSPSVPTCEASGLLMAIDSLPTQSNYMLTWSFSGTQLAPAAGCTSGGYTNFSLSATPVTGSISKRTFFLTGTDMLLHYSDVGNADINSPVWVW